MRADVSHAPMRTAGPSRLTAGLVGAERPRNVFMRVVGAPSLLHYGRSAARVSSFQGGGRMSKAIAHGAKIRGIVMSGALAGAAGCPASGSGTETTDAATTTTTGTTGSSTDAAPTTSGATTTTTTGTTGVETTGTTAGTTTGTTGTTTGVGTTGATSGGTTGDDEVDFGCDDTTAGDTTGGDTDGPGVCACILDDAEGDWGEAPSQPICGETLCVAVKAGCEGYCDFEIPLVVEDPVALKCALTALRDRTPGIIRWYFSEAGGQYSDHGYVLIRDDGTAIRRHWGAQDLDYVVSDALYGTMPDACAFEQCLAAGSAELRFDCMRKFPLGPTVACDDGWLNTDF